ncbi:Putative retroelement [Phytophthora palmivora]|uniref:Retroelement n=1 Tax=Phytophthora palmivora TaxID=4796 RepID=A0A2P4YKT5_9STRA|nr:Putative retroelement [Phytophthora palmivora]
MTYEYDGILGRPWLEQCNPVIDWTNHTIAFPSTGSVTDAPLVHSEKLTVSEVTLEKLRRRLETDKYVEVYKVEARHTEDTKPVATAVRLLLGEFQDVLPETLPDQLPPEREVEHENILRPDAVPAARTLFRHSPVERAALSAYVSELLRKGWIEQSNSPWASSIFAVPKKDPVTGSTVRKMDWNRSGDISHPGRIDDLLDTLQGARIFSSIDLTSGYHQMRLKKDSRPPTAVQADGELFQWVVAPMGLAGMPGSWTRLMRYIFGNPHLSRFCVVYLDDICVLSPSIDAHVEHLRAVLSALRSAGLYANPRKCTWAQGAITVLGHRISNATITLDPAKTLAMKKIAPPTNIRELQRFLGLCGYYRRFLPACADLVQPLSDLLKSSSTWTWGQSQTIAFDQVKDMIQHSPVLKLPDFTRQFFVTTDASDIAVGGVLSQVYPSGEHPVAYLSRKLSDTEQRWPAHEKELFAIKFCLEKWRPYLLGVKFTFYTDNIACKWFFTKNQPSPKLLRCFDTFSQYTFDIFHRAGRTNVVADALSRPVVVSSLAVASLDPIFATRVKELYSTDSVCINILQQLQSVTSQSNQYILEDGLIVVKDGQRKRFVLPRDDRLLLDVLIQYHDEATIAHPGVVRTYLAVRQDIVWSGLRSTVEDYVRICETCMKNKTGERKKGLLHPLPILEAPWVDIAMDFVTGLPVSGGYDAVCVVVCRLSKRARYLPTRKTVTAEEVARSFFDNVIHGVPRSIVSDRDPKFLSKFWQALMATLHAELRMTVSHRAQADGQSGRQIRTLEDVLRCTVSHYGDDWSEWLMSIEYAHASLINTSTGKTPMEVDTGRKPVPRLRATSDVCIFLEDRQAAIEYAKDQLAKAQEGQKRFYDRNRTNTTFNITDFVYVRANLLNKDFGTPDYDITKGPTKNKFLPRWVGPFPIAKRIGTNSYKLVLPQTLRSHDVFNVDQLKLSLGCPPEFFGRPVRRTAPVLFDDQGHRIYVIAALLKKRRHRGHIQYLVKWADLPDSENSWENVRNISKVSQWLALLNAFHRRLRPPTSA